MTAIADTGPGRHRWRYFGYAVVALGVMTVAIASHDHWFLNFVHVICGVLWTGIDLFMGFVIGPILRKVGLSVRREIIVRLVPRTLFLMPTLSIITGRRLVLAKDLGLLDVPWPQFGWVAAALALVILMTIQGAGYLLPTNLRVCVQLRRPDPDVAKINRVMGNFFFVVLIGRPVHVHVQSDQIGQIRSPGEVRVERNPRLGRRCGRHGGRDESYSRQPSGQPTPPQ